MAARSVSAAKFLLISTTRQALTRRGIAYAPLLNGTGHVASGCMVVKNGPESDNSWGPDPVTGFYRPVNRAAEIDVAELRNVLLKNPVRANHDTSMFVTR